MLLSALALVLQDARPAVPDDARQKDAEKLIRDVFQDDYKKATPAERKDLALVFIDQGVRTTDDAAARFVLLREARDLAAQAGDLDVAFRAIGEMAKLFRVEPHGMKHGVLGAVTRSAKTPEECRPAAAAYLKLADDALADDDVATATQAVSSALAMARRAKDAPLTTRVEAKQKELSEVRGRYEKAARAREALAKTPDDGASCSVLGHFVCAVKGQWSEGLPLLVKGSDPALKSAAEKDLANPGEAAERASAGDAWWDLAVKETGIAKERLRARALHWYAQALPGLSGVARTKIEKRVVELRVEAMGGSWQDVTAAFDKGTPVELNAPSDGALKLPLRDFPAGTFDGVTAIIKRGGAVHVMGGFLLDSDDYLINLQFGNKCVLASAWTSGKWERKGTADLPEREEYILTVLIKDGHYVVYVDGEEKTRAATRSTQISNFALQSDDGQVLYDKIKLRRKE